MKTNGKLIQWKETKCHTFHLKFCQMSGFWQKKNLGVIKQNEMK